jgi:hypothetical protein
VTRVRFARPVTLQEDNPETLRQAQVSMTTPFRGELLGARFLKSLIPMFVEYREGSTWHTCQLSRYRHKPPTYVFRRLDKAPQHSALPEHEFSSPLAAYAFACRESRRRGGHMKQWRKVDIARMTPKHWHVRGAPKDETAVVVLRPGMVIDLD